jgi:hypothetical protein
MSEIKGEIKERFVLKKVTNFNEAKIGDELPPSDFSILNDKGEFLQYEYKNEEDKARKLEVKPGIFTIRKGPLGDLTLHKTGFNNDAVLQEYDFTKKITDRINNFFNKIPIYKHYELFPKRGMLLYGKPGVGKSQAINSVCLEYSNKGETAVVLWSTSDWDAGDVKDMIQSFEYKGVERLILVAEDIGGAEYVGSKMVIKASLLSLLDNMESTFKIPTMILATTNYPENLLEALTNRPQRFDDIMEVPAPNGEQRTKLLAFFLRNDVNFKVEDANIVADKKYDGLSVAHLKEAIIRAALNDLTLQKSLDQVAAQCKRALDDFEKKKKMGIGFGGSSIIDDSDD